MTTTQQPLPGPQCAATATPPRAPASARRTTTIDITRPEGLIGPVVAVVAGQDLATEATGRSSVVERYSVDVPIDMSSAEVLGFEGGEETTGTPGSGAPARPRSCCSPGGR
jgi:hypothetical protein